MAARLIRDGARYLAYPLLVLGWLVLRAVIIPLYRLYLALKSATIGTPIIRFQSFPFRSLVRHHWTFLLLGAGVLVVVVHNVQSHQLYAEEMGSHTTLYSLVQEAEMLEVDSRPVAFRGTIQRESEFASVVVEGGPERGIDDIQGDTVLGDDGTVFPQASEGMGAVRTRESVETYVVQEGNTVSSIAYQFGISVNTILWANKLGGYSVLRPGQRLEILPVSGVEYTVKSGDTVSGVAKRYQISEDEIRSINKLSESGVLAKGEILILPGASPLGVGIASSARPAPFSSGAYAPRRVSTAGFIWPAPGRRINQYFSWRHTGIDIDNKTANDPIYAAEPGTVIQAGWNSGGYGNRVLVQHAGGIQTNYGHLKKILAKSGQKVQKGDVIGIMGTTGRSTGIHLHFEIIASGKRVNPLSYLK